ncbi:ABC transporter ATP-binding protein [Haloplasma contractile]|uniref:Lipoprotein-releasing system ATP-binding protein n=1 Tax=Haloplasma contractile SSD-17B TaxID=1033810 RepID=U2FMX6_9MOLU|nr:ABC transporter ATP-binding protein [Haloplasma contractile]ERJ12494.1 lipoprotein-releasing system ATP-binding protein [Haloplasma contractile SSD-17B]
MSIKVEQVKKTYVTGEVKTHALRGIDLKIKEGELVVILGPSGSGKSTLLNVISGLDTVTEGTIRVNNQEITSYNEKKLTSFRRNKLGFIFQSYNLLPNLTTYENVEVGEYLSKSPLSINDILNQVGLKSEKNKFPYQMSGGQQQRVSIARAVVKNPSILFCDEPTGSLDEDTGKQVLKVLQDLNNELGTTIIIVTHNIAIKDIADRVIKMRSGEIDEIITNDQKIDAKEVSWG